MAASGSTVHFLTMRTLLHSHNRTSFPMDAISLIS
jgi:hypothetical protein